MASGVCAQLRELHQESWRYGPEVLPSPLLASSEDPFDDFDEDDFDDDFDDDFEEDWEDDLTEDEEFPDTFGGQDDDGVKSPFSDDPDFDE